MPPVVITLRQDAEDFQTADDVLDHHPAARQLPIVPLLLLGKSAFARLLPRRPALCMQLVQPLVAAVGQHLQALVRLDTAALVEGEVVDGAARRAVQMTSRVRPLTTTCDFSVCRCFFPL